MQFPRKQNLHGMLCYWMRVQALPPCLLAAPHGCYWPVDAELEPAMNDVHFLGSPELFVPLWMLGVNTKPAFIIHDYMYQFSKVWMQRAHADQVLYMNLHRLVVAEAQCVSRMLTRRRLSRANEYFHFVREYGQYYFSISGYEPQQWMETP